jgi:hypothetical protein
MEFLYIALFGMLVPLATNYFDVKLKEDSNHNSTSWLYVRVGLLLSSIGGLVIMNLMNLTTNASEYISISLLFVFSILLILYTMDATTQYLQFNQAIVYWLIIILLPTMDTDTYKYAIAFILGAFISSVSYLGLYHFIINKDEEIASNANCPNDKLFFENKQDIMTNIRELNEIITTNNRILTGVFVLFLMIVILLHMYTK